MKGFISPQKSTRDAVTQREREWARLEGKTVFSLFVDEYDKESLLFAPGYRGSIGMDVLYEIFRHSLSMKDFALKGSMALVVDQLSVGAGDTENYWTTSARLIARSLLPVSVEVWKEMHPTSRTRKEADPEEGSTIPSLSAVFMTLVEELMAAKGRRNWSSPSWWGKLEDHDRRLLIGLVVNNAQQTSGCIFAELHASLSALQEIASPHKTALLGTDPVSVYVPALTPRGFNLLLNVLSSRDCLVIAEGIGGWDSQHQLVLRKYAPSLNLFWTSSLAPDRAFCTGSLGFGQLNDAMSMTVFAEKVKDTTGNSSGRVLTLPVETPMDLQDHQALWFFDSWLLMNVPGEVERKEMTVPFKAESELDCFIRFFEKGEPLPEEHSASVFDPDEEDDEEDEFDRSDFPDFL